MPEAAVYEDRNAFSPEDYVCTAAEGWYGSNIEAIPQAVGVKGLAQGQLCRGVALTLTSHPPPNRVGRRRRHTAPAIDGRPSALVCVFGGHHPPSGSHTPRTLRQGVSAPALPPSR